MAIYQIAPDGLLAVPETKFDAEKLFERKDIQRYLKGNIEALGSGLMVVAEEFGDWLDSARRIDLLCIDTDANLVVVELKRGEDGGFMDLQAIRYAAMISAMTFDQLVDCHARYRSKVDPDVDLARAALLDFLKWDVVDTDAFGRDVRIILASADFSKELTTSVLWLRDYEIDIRCVRLKPYKLLDGPVLIDIQQLVPLPEAASFQTQIGVKSQSQRKNRAERHDLRLKFWEGLLARARVKTSLHSGRTPSQDNWISGSIGRNGFSLTYTVRQQDCQVELWIAFGAGQSQRNKAAFHALLTDKGAIEADFGDELDWRELPDRDGCRISRLIDGGYKDLPETWPELHERMIDAMIRLDKALRVRVQALKV